MIDPDATKLATKLLIEALMSRATKQRVSKSKKRAVCVHRGCPNKADHGCRGCCKHHYNQFDYACRVIERSKGKHARMLFDAKEVAAGNVLPSARGKHSKRNPYLDRAV